VQKKTRKSFALDLKSNRLGADKDGITPLRVLYLPIRNADVFKNVEKWIRWQSANQTSITPPSSTYFDDVFKIC
jgi:hypothetical protein